MALGGGLYTEQDKFLPGAYHKFYSEPNNEIQLTERGVVAVAMVLNWQPEEVIRIQNIKDYSIRTEVPQWTRDCFKIFGYDADAPELINVREMFRHAREILILPLGSPKKASNTFGDAKNGGIRGNDITNIITANIDDSSLFDVLTYVDLKLVDSQTVAKASDLVDNNWVIWKKDAVLAETASAPMTGGANASATGQDHMNALTAFELLRFNTLICPATDEETIKVYVEWTTRMNEKFGRWHGLVVYNYLADNFYVTTVKNTVDGGEGPELVYYTGGEQAGCKPQAVTDNKRYLGEYTVLEATKDIQELEYMLRQGYYLYHKVEGEIRVLADNNSFVTFTNEHQIEFSYNQTIRVFDQLATDSDRIFINEFLGVAGTDDFDLANFKIRMIAVREKLQSMGAIKNFQATDLVVTNGQQFDSYHLKEYIQPNYCVRKLYTETIVGTIGRGDR